MREASIKSIWTSWQAWAIASALFAALTAIFGKVGVERVNPDFATLLRVGVILLFSACLVAMTGAAQPLATITTRTWVFLIASGLATGASWLCYYRALKLGQAAQVAPIDKLSVVLVAILGATFLGEKLSLANWLGVAMIAGGAVLAALRA